MAGRPDGTGKAFLHEKPKRKMASEPMPSGIIVSNIIKNKRCLNPVGVRMVTLTGRVRLFAKQRRDYSGIGSAALNFSLLLSFSFKKKESKHIPLLRSSKILMKIIGYKYSIPTGLNDCPDVRANSHSPLHQDLSIVSANH